MTITSTTLNYLATTDNVLPLSSYGKQQWTNYFGDTFLADRAENYYDQQLVQAQGAFNEKGLSNTSISWLVSVPGDGMRSVDVVTYTFTDQPWMRNERLAARTKLTTNAINPVSPVAFSSVTVYDNVANLAKVGGGGGGGHERPDDGFLYPVC